jgi:coenzyme F420-0:L-glutamate ligase / coenzyme F420-1:gamma-L-glutamate ligase
VSAVEIATIEGIPEIREGEALGRLIADRSALRDGDIVVIAQKVVSKAEGRTRSLATVEPGRRARDLASSVGKDPRLVQLVLDESRAVLRAEGGALIVETHGGWICANAGIDSSNVPGDESVSLLPEDADASARRIRAEIADASGRRPAVIVSDSFGRPWRLGQAEVAIGCAGVLPLDDWRERTDRLGGTLTATVIATADQLAAVADLARTKASGEPAVLLRGLERLVTRDDGPGASALRRPENEDLFR